MLWGLAEEANRGARGNVLAMVHFLALSHTHTPSHSVFHSLLALQTRHMHSTAVLCVLLCAYSSSGGDGGSESIMIAKYIERALNLQVCLYEHASHMLR